MRKRAGGEPGQTVPEMREDANERKETQQLQRSKGQSYRGATVSDMAEEVRAIQRRNLDEMGEVITSTPVILDNDSDVKLRSLAYLRVCEEAGTFASNLGLARALGHSDRSLRSWRSRHPDHPTGKWLEQCSELFADNLAQAGLSGVANNIMSIFLSKAVYGLRETSELVLTPNSTQFDEDEYDADAIRARYLIDTNNDTTE